MEVRMLASIDYLIIILYGILSIAVGIYCTKRASKNVNEFFLTGRSMPWWLIGTSMAATNFSIDTPLAITKYVFQEGVGGVWFFWAFAITGILATFFFSRMWRKAHVMTDNEIVEHRYSGKPAAVLRVFKGFYFGVIINCFVMGWVLLGVIKVLSGVTNLDPFWILVVSTAAVAIYTLAAGLYGVILTDFIQYFFALAGSFLLAYYSVKGVGGLSAMVNTLHSTFGADSGVTNFVPTFSTAKWMPLNIFMVYILVQWWAQKYSDGGGKHIQRMSSAKNETHATIGTFFFAIMNYAVQTWPWILVALCAIIVYGRDVADPEKTYAWMMMKWLPHGVLGLMLVSLIAAFMSTIATHLNLGGSYMINDIYKRFFVKNASDKHYVFMSRVATAFTLGIAILIASNIKSIGDTWKFILEFTSGAGLVYVLRWFWWRVNAWSELSAMVTSAIVATFMKFTYPKLDYGFTILIIVGISTLIWVTVTLLTKPTDEDKLTKFVRQVHPGSPGWKYIYNKYGIEYTGIAKHSLINTIIGIIFFLSLNFGMGSYLLLKTKMAVVLTIVAVSSGAALLWRVLSESRRKKRAEKMNVATDSTAQPSALNLECSIEKA